MARTGVVSSLDRAPQPFPRGGVDGGGARSLSGTTSSSRLGPSSAWVHAGRPAERLAGGALDARQLPYVLRKYSYDYPDADAARALGPAAPADICILKPGNAARARNKKERLSARDRVRCSP